MTSLSSLLSYVGSSPTGNFDEALVSAVSGMRPLRGTDISFYDVVHLYGLGCLHVNVRRSPQAPPTTEPPAQRYTGSSIAPSINEALASAVAQIRRQVEAGPETVLYEVVRIHGNSGGFTGRITLCVEVQPLAQGAPVLEAVPASPVFTGHSDTGKFDEALAAALAEMVKQPGVDADLYEVVRISGQLLLDGDATRKNTLFVAVRSTLPIESTEVRAEPADAVATGPSLQVSGILGLSANIGCETEGHCLGQATLASLDVDAHGIDPALVDSLQGKKVEIRGKLYLKNYVERGEVWILKVSDIAEAAP